MVVKEGYDLQEVKVIPRFPKEMQRAVFQYHRNSCDAQSLLYQCHALQVAWAEHCRYQTVMNQLTVTVSSVERRELLIDWHTDPESIGQNMAQLKKRSHHTIAHVPNAPQT